MLKKHKALVGYFSDQPEHTTAKMTYANLMAIHEFGVPEENIPARPVMQLTQNYGNLSQEDIDAIRKAFKGFFSEKVPYNKVGTYLNNVGMYYQAKGKSFFGSTMLTPTKRGNDPLIDTSELRDNFSYRTTITYKVT